MNIANTVNAKMPEIKAVMASTGATRGDATFMVMVANFEAYTFSKAQSESAAFKVLAMRDELALLCHPEIKNVAATRELNKALYHDRIEEIKTAA
jgi:hypothetical protein